MPSLSRWLGSFLRCNNLLSFDKHCRLIYYFSETWTFKSPLKEPQSEHSPFFQPVCEVLARTRVPHALAAL